jgi:hypothetical protein
MQNYAPVEADEAAEVGVPSPTNLYLPNFSDYGKPFFERQGLRFRLGPVHFNVSLALGAEYCDNVFITSENPTPDMIVRASPFFQFGIGDYHARSEDYLLMDYRPSYDYYFGNSGLNRLNQTLDVGGRATFSRYTTAVTLGYVNSNAPNATQSNRQNYQLLNFNWDNSYYLTAKTFARLTLTALGQQYENSDQYITYSASPMLGYEYSPKTTVFFGPYAGIAYIGSTDASGSSGTQTFQGVTCGINYSNLRKIKFDGVVGVQARQFNGFNASGASNFMTPIFDFTLTYSPREKTDLVLELVRNVQISDILQGLTYTNNEVQFNIAHHLTDHVTLYLGLDYQYLEYQGQDPDGRTDSYLFASPSISYTFWRELCTLNVYYRCQQRTSSVQTSNYMVNSYGLQFIFQF